jgi:hypothetical protein
LLLLAFFSLLVFGGGTVGAAGVPATAPAAPEVTALAARIDRYIRAGYSAAKLQPAGPADDAEFLRRVYLDLAGRIPHVAEAREFLADPSPDKRRLLVERLLDSPQYVSHFTAVWRSLLIPTNNQQAVFFRQQLEPWLGKRLRDNQHYDAMVRELLTASPPAAPQPGPRPVQGGAGALAFFQAHEYKPEELASSTARIFLGVKLECAQCHDHPFARWTRPQFWELAAFYAGFQQRMGPANGFGIRPEATDQRELKIPGTDKTVRARFLGGAAPDLKPNVSARVALADWVTSPTNPYFARAAVNRVWAHFFGPGIVEPIDDLNETNAPSHPELLDDLARAFVESRFDMKFLIRAITASQTYQLGSAGGAASTDSRRFTRMSLKALTAEELFDSLAVATGFNENANAPSRGPVVVFGGFGGVRNDFLAKFANPGERRTEQQTSILQALALMNGKLTADATHLQRSMTLAAVLDSPFLDWRQRLDTLFLATLTRPMRTAEVDRFVPYVTSGGPSGDSRKALADVFWALLNSTEFYLNH